MHACKKHSARGSTSILLSSFLFPRLDGNHFHTPYRRQPSKPLGDINQHGIMTGIDFWLTFPSQDIIFPEGTALSSRVIHRGITNSDSSLSFSPPSTFDSLFFSPFPRWNRWFSTSISTPRTFPLFPSPSFLSLSILALSYSNVKKLSAVEAVLRRFFHLPIG